MEGTPSGGTKRSYSKNNSTGYKRELSNKLDMSKEKSRKLGLKKNRLKS